MSVLLSIVSKPDEQIGACMLKADLPGVKDFVMLCIGDVNIHVTPTQARQIVYQLEKAIKQKATGAAVAQ